MTKILVIEDEPVMRELLRDNLQFEGYQVSEAGTLREANSRIEEKPDLVLLDVNLPDGDGIESLISWRSRGIQTPILVCTVKDREIDTIRALDGGADDYVSKPFRIRELLSRVRAILRRRNKQKSEIVQLGKCSINFKSKTIFIEGKEVFLTATEWILLDFFHQNQGCVVSREQIIEHVWGLKELDDSRAVDAHIGRLRKKIRDFEVPQFLLTVRGLGYKLIFKT